jgi:branched-chain amino acid aminotransferase
MPFGKFFSDHMLEADFENGEWKNVEIKPYQPLVIEPSMASLHYGQAIFEGIKAYKDAAGNASVFRPYDNFKRFNISAERMNMPTVPEEIFIDGLKQLLALDKQWIPSKTDHSLYIRPFMFSTDNVLGVQTSHTYKFMILLSPTGPYYAKPMRIYVEEKYTRAAPGGVGYAKAAGNYGASMLATAEAKKIGYDQVLWTDAHEHKYMEEIGTMNVFFAFANKKIVTPALDGNILDGVTRNSTIQLLEENGYTVEERRISIDELKEKHEAGELLEVFGTGTAATISFIQELRYKEYTMEFDTNTWVTAPFVKATLNDIRYGKVADRFDWLLHV